MHGRNSQVARIYRILNLLERAPQGLSVLEIWERMAERDFKVSKRTIYRDLEALCEAGFPLFPSESQTDEMGTRWILEADAKVGQYLALSSQELFALYLVRGMLVPLKETPMHADFERAFRKIEEKLGTSHREYLCELSSEVRFEEVNSGYLELDHEILETIRAACAERHILSVDYESANSGKRSQRRLGPHYLYFAKGSIYLLAEDLEVAETKLFALPRIHHAVMEEEPYDGSCVEPETFFKTSFGVFHGGQPLSVKVEFAKNVAHYIKERRWHRSQTLCERPDGTVQLSMIVAITPELIQWILGFGGDAQVLEPESLRVEVGKSIVKMAKQYAVG